MKIKRRYSKIYNKITAVIILFFLISTTFSSVSANFFQQNNKEEDTNVEEDQNKGIVDKILDKTQIDEKINEFKEKIRNFFNRDNDNVLLNNSKSLTAGSLSDILVLHTNYSNNESSESFGLSNDAEIDVNNDGTKDVSASITIKLGIVSDPFGLSINFVTKFKRLSGFDELDLSKNFTCYSEISFLKAKYGYNLDEAGKFPQESSFVYKYANFLRIFKSSRHIIEAQAIDGEKHDITVMFGVENFIVNVNFENFAKTSLEITKNKNEEGRIVSVWSEKKTDIKVLLNKISQDSETGLFIKDFPANEKISFKAELSLLEDGALFKFSWEKINGPSMNVMFYRESAKNEKFDYFYIKYLPNKFSFSMSKIFPLLEGWIKVDTGGESINQIGFCDDLSNPKEYFYFADLPTTIEFSWILKLRDGGISLYVDKGLSFNGHYTKQGIFDGENIVNISLFTQDQIDLDISWNVFRGYLKVERKSLCSFDFTFDSSSEYGKISTKGSVSRSKDPFIIDLGFLLNGPILDLDVSFAVEFSCGSDFTLSELILDIDDLPLYMSSLANNILPNNATLDIYVNLQNIEVTNSLYSERIFTVSIIPLLDSASFRTYVSKGTSFTWGSSDIDIKIEEVRIPTVNITYPTEEDDMPAFVDGIVTITGTASSGDDSRSVEKVQIKIDNSGWEDVNGKEAWSYILDTSTLEDGEHYIKARSYNGLYFSKIDSLIIYVGNSGDELESPTVNIEKPTLYLKVTGDIQVEGKATPVSSTRPIKYVQIKIIPIRNIDLVKQNIPSFFGPEIGTDWINVTGTNNWNYVWSSSKIAMGYNMIIARCYDGEYYSNVPQGYYDMISSGSGVIFYVENKDVTEISDMTYEIDIVKEKSSYINIKDFDLDFEYISLKENDEGQQKSLDFSVNFSELEFDTSDESKHFSVILDLKDGTFSVSNEKPGSKLTIKDINISVETHNFELTKLIPDFPLLNNISQFFNNLNQDDLYLSLSVGEFIFDGSDVTKESGLFVNFDKSKYDDSNKLVIGFTCQISKDIDIYDIRIILNNLKWNISELFGDDSTKVFWFNLVIENVTFDIAKDLSWGWLKIGPSGQIFFFSDYIKTDENGKVLFQLSGTFKFYNEEGFFKLSWETLDDGNLSVTVNGNLLWDVTNGRIRIGEEDEAFVLNLDKLHTGNGEANINASFVSKNYFKLRCNSTRTFSRNLDFSSDISLHIPKENVLINLKRDWDISLSGSIKRRASGDLNKNNIEFEWYKNDSIYLNFDRDSNREIALYVDNFNFEVSGEKSALSFEVVNISRHVNQGTGKCMLEIGLNADGTLNELNVSVNLTNGKLTVKQFKLSYTELNGKTMTIFFDTEDFTSKTLSFYFINNSLIKEAGFYFNKVGYESLDLSFSNINFFRYYSKNVNDFTASLDIEWKGQIPNSLEYADIYGRWDRYSDSFNQINLTLFGKNLELTTEYERTDIERNLHIYYKNDSVSGHYLLLDYDGKTNDNGNYKLKLLGFEAKYVGSLTDLHLDVKWKQDSFVDGYFYFDRTSLSGTVDVDISLFNKEIELLVEKIQNKNYINVSFEWYKNDHLLLDSIFDIQCTRTLFKIAHNTNIVKFDASNVYLSGKINLAYDDSTQLGNLIIDCNSGNIQFSSFNFEIGDWFALSNTETTVLQRGTYIDLDWSGNVIDKKLNYLDGYVKLEKSETSYKNFSLKLFTNIYVFRIKGGASASTRTLDFFFDNRNTNKKLHADFIGDISNCNYKIDLFGVEAEISGRITDWSIDVNWVTNSYAYGYFALNRKAISGTLDINIKLLGGKQLLFEGVQRYRDINVSFDWDIVEKSVYINSKFELSCTNIKYVSDYLFEISNSNLKGDFTLKLDKNSNDKFTQIHLSSVNGLTGSFSYMKLSKNANEIFKLLYGSVNLNTFDLNLYNIQYHSSNGNLKQLELNVECDFSGTFGTIKLFNSWSLNLDLYGDLNGKIILDTDGTVDELDVGSNNGLYGSLKVNKATQTWEAALSVAIPFDAHYIAETTSSPDQLNINIPSNNQMSLFEIKHYVSLVKDWTFSIGQLHVTSGNVNIKWDINDADGQLSYINISNNVIVDFDGISYEKGIKKVTILDLHLTPGYIYIETLKNNNNGLLFIRNTASAAMTFLEIKRSFDIFRLGKVTDIGSVVIQPGRFKLQWENITDPNDDYDLKCIVNNGIFNIHPLKTTIMIGSLDVSLSFFETECDYENDITFKFRNGGTKNRAIYIDTEDYVDLDTFVLRIAGTNWELKIDILELNAQFDGTYIGYFGTGKLIHGGKINLSIDPIDIKFSFLWDENGAEQNLSASFCQPDTNNLDTYQLTLDTTQCTENLDISFVSFNLGPWLLEGQVSIYANRQLLVDWDADPTDSTDNLGEWHIKVDTNEQVIGSISITALRYISLLNAYIGAQISINNIKATGGNGYLYSEGTFIEIVEDCWFPNGWIASGNLEGSGNLDFKRWDGEWVNLWPIGNSPPIASFTCSDTNPDVGEMVTFDASASYDPDPLGFVAYIRWDWGEGDNDENDWTSWHLFSTWKIVQHSYSLSGYKTIRCQVADVRGLVSAIVSNVIFVGSNSAPVLYEHSLTPDQGYPEGHPQETLFTFKIKYKDYNEDAPEYMKLYIDGLYYCDMDCYYSSSGSGVYTAWFRKYTYLNPGDHTYSFKTSDGNTEVTAGPYLGPNVTSLNNPPSVSGYVSPESGTTNTLFSYHATYTDPENDPVGSRHHVYIDGSQHEMTYVATYASGYLLHHEYKYETTLSAGNNHQYYFQFSDNQGHTVTTNVQYGPTVTYGNQAPTLVMHGYLPFSGDPSTLFTFTVTYTDPDGDAPYVKKIYIDDANENGNGHIMTYAGGSYSTGAAFTYQTTLPVGGHVYHYRFDDGHGHSVRAPPQGNEAPGPTVDPYNQPPDAYIYVYKKNGEDWEFIGGTDEIDSLPASALSEYNFKAYGPSGHPGPNDPDGNIVQYKWYVENVSQGSDWDSGWLNIADTGGVIKSSFELFGEIQWKCSEWYGYYVSLTVKDNDGDTGGDMLDIVLDDPEWLRAQDDVDNDWDYEYKARDNVSGTADSTYAVFDEYRALSKWSDPLVLTYNVSIIIDAFRINAKYVSQFNCMEIRFRLNDVVQGDLIHFDSWPNHGDITEFLDDEIEINKVEIWFETKTGYRFNNYPAWVYDFECRTDVSYT